MIVINLFYKKKVFLFGLGASGLATAKALEAGGATVLAFDDNKRSQEEARACGLILAEPHKVCWEEMAALILAPGIPLTHPEPHYVVRLAQKHEVPILGDLELFSLQREHFLKSQGLSSAQMPFIAVTGTNGKSTTTSLIAHILKESGFDVEIGGNIGIPVLQLRPFQQGRIYVIECSSFQIDLAPSLMPSLGILLNITPDHIDRHGSFEAYQALKVQLIAQAQKAILCVDNPFCAAAFTQLEAQNKEPIAVSAQRRLEHGYFYEDGKLYKATHGQEAQAYATLYGNIALRGPHNAQNALAALAVADQLHISKNHIAKALNTYEALPHRMQQVRSLGKVLFINDSKATNAEASAPALETFDHIYWIIGGLAKEGGIEALRAFFPKIKKAYLIGEAAEDFSRTIAQAFPFSLCGTLEKAVQQAAQDAAQDSAPEAVVLLSPACASYDQFKNYSERGAQFVRLVHAL